MIKLYLRRNNLLYLFLISYIRSLINTTITLILASFIYNALLYLAQHTSSINLDYKSELIMCLDVI